VTAVRDVEVADDAVGDIRLEQGLDRARAILPASDRLEQDRGGLTRIWRKDLDRVVPNLLLELLDEFRTRTGEGLGRLPRQPYEHAGRVGARLIDRRLLREAVGGEQLHPPVVRTQHRDLVLDQLGTVLLEDRAEKDGIRPGRLYLLHQVGVAVRLQVVVLDARDLDAERPRGPLERPALALAGRVVRGDQDEGAPHPLVLGEAGEPGALAGVVGDNPGVVAGPGRVVDVGLRPAA